MKTKETFDQYYVRYLTYHTKWWTKFWHLIGNIATIAFIVYVIMYLSLWWLLLSPVIVYPFAWGSHWLVEGNVPAFFKGNQLRAKMSDWKMQWQWLTGKL